MKKTLLHATLAGAALLLAPALHAINVSEPPDFPNSPAAVTAPFTFTLSAGNNVFSGQCAVGAGDADYFKVFIPAGLRISAIQTAPSGFASSFSVPATPAVAGTYTCGINPGQIISDVNWTITFTVQTQPDYDVIISGGVMTVTNNSNNGDTLNVTEPSAGNIAFGASGRSFRLNFGPQVSNNSGAVSLSSVTSIVVNAGNGGETINVGAFSGSSFPSLTIVGGVGNDTVNFTGNITFASNNNLTVNLQSGGSPGVDAITVSNSAQLTAQANGVIDLECSRSISITGGAVLQTVNGKIDVEANQQTPATTGNFTGVDLDGSTTRIQTTGSTSNGNITVKGVGGNDPGGGQLGVGVFNGAQIAITNINSLGSINVTGSGGASSGIVNRGVTVYGAGSAITSGSSQPFSAVTVVGTAGAQGSGYGIGVSVLYGGKISTNGNDHGTTVNGTGGGASGDSNQGVEIGGAATPASAITASHEVDITGIPGPGSSVGLYMSDAAAVGSPPIVNISADSMSLNDTASITATSPSNGIFISTIAATHINLGGANAAGTLGLSVAELAQLKTPALGFQTAANGDITISQPISRSTATDLILYTGGGGLFATASGTDVNLAGGTLYLAGGLFDVPITGPAADTGFPQLNVTGGVNIGINGNVPLNLAGTTYAGNIGQQFTILKNNNNAAITGTFANLPEGAYLVWPGDNTLAAKISYVGGSGHDVVLTLVPVAQALTVTTTANDSSVGSLGATIAFAASHPGADTITFNPSLSGQTITLTSQISVGESGTVTIDASNLANGLTIQGGGPSGSFRLFNIGSSTTVTLRGLTLTNGGGSAFASGLGQGGAINNFGVLTLVGCTLSSNSASTGGAIYNGGIAGQLTLLQCTLTGNSASNGDGGAIYNSGTLTLNQCTLTGNTAPNSNPRSGAILNTNTLTITNSIVSGNPFVIGNEIVQTSGSTAFRGKDAVRSFDLISGSFSQDALPILGDPLLATLGNYGGPTQTMPPLLGSSAIDAGVNSAIPNDPATGVPFTTDQRGKTRIQNGSVDIGAVETSAFQVTIAGDNGSPGTLRSIVSAATDITNTITFAPGLSGGQIAYIAARGEIPLTKNFAIDASALPGGITITAGTTSRLFSVSGAQTTVVLTGLTLTGGNGVGTTASGSGGAIFNNGATLTLNQCALTSNATSGGSAVGGAIRQSTGTITLNRCTVANNTATTTNANVGGVAGGSGTLTLNQCTFTGNSTVGIGGALSIAGGGTLNVTQCTIAGNNAGTNGGGINSNGATTLTNSIVATNSGVVADINNSGGTVTRVGGNIIGDNNTVATQFPVGSPNANGDYVGTSVSPVNPLLAPLGSYGGPTFTMALLMGTPARNAAFNSAFTSDQRGFAITDGHPDIGAYEAGDISNYFAWIYENLPASSANNAAAHAATFDYDGDGVTNFNEWLELTNPGDPASYLHITQTTRSGSNLSITFTSVLGRHYTVEGCNDLIGWSSIDGPMSGTGSAITRSYILPTGTTPKYFLRVRGGP